MVEPVMGAAENSLTSSPPVSSRSDLAQLLGPGVMSLGPGGGVGFADRRALELLGCAGARELERLWEELRSRLENAGLSWNGAGGDAGAVALELPVAESPQPGEASGAPPATTARRLLFDLRRYPGGGGILLIQDLGTLAGLESDLRLTAQMRSVAQISPAVAHDLRAPINAMVFNLEILLEMIASGRAADPGARDKLLRYVNVLKEELSRLHQGLETFLAYISPRSDKVETLDLREASRELASLLVAPARKEQVQVKAELPEQPVPAEANRYLLRQALLHVALAALAGVPKQGTLHVRLERLDGRARLRVYGVAGAESPAGAAAAEAPDFALRFSPAGALAGLWVARSILAAHGGEARAADPAASPGGTLPAYEIDLTISASSNTGTQD
jgi:signal transduction histidine kinase